MTHGRVLPSRVLVSTCSLHLTTFCLQYRPTVVACVCIHLACKWSNWEIPVSTDGKHWWEYVDRTVTLQLLDGAFVDAVERLRGSVSGTGLDFGLLFSELTHEFLQILEKTPSRLKRIRNWRVRFLQMVAQVRTSRLPAPHVGLLLVFRPFKQPRSQRRRVQRWTVPSRGRP